MEWLKLNLDLMVFATLGLMAFLFVFLTIERIIYYVGFDVSSYSQLEPLEINLSKNLTLIATIGTNAPYVGLLGTVLGVMITFYDIAQSGQIEASSVMLGLALALKATAAGIAVAIPAMVSYNLLERKMDVLIQLWKSQQKQ